MSNLDPISVPGADSSSIGGRLREAGREHHGYIRNSRLEGWAQSFWGVENKPGEIFEVSREERKYEKRQWSPVQCGRVHWLGLHSDTPSQV